MNQWIGHLAVQTIGLFALGLAALLIRKLMKRDPVLLYRTTTVLLLSVLLLPFIQFQFQGKAIPSIKDWVGTSELIPGTMSQRSEQNSVSRNDELTPSSPEPLASISHSTIMLGLNPSHDPVQEPSRQPLQNWTGWDWSNLWGMTGWLVLYAFGALFFLALHSVRWLRTERIISRSCPVQAREIRDLWKKIVGPSRLRNRIELLSSSEVATPGCWGLARPKVIVPTSCLEGRNTSLAWALRHELVHLERRDSIVVFLQIVATTLFWFHPVAWWLSREVDRHRETSCDHMVVRNTGRAKSYALALMEFATQLLSTRHSRSQQRTVAATTFLHWSRSTSQLQRRIRMLEHGWKPLPRTTRMFRGITLLLLFCGIWTGQMVIAATFISPHEDPIPPSTTVSSQAGSDDQDSDFDGLSDFSEIHKYKTDPYRADSDGDGASDSAWPERREFTYTIRTIIQVMPPYNLSALNDDFQDVRVLDERKEYVELEIIHYPLNTVHEAIEANPNWIADAAMMKEYLSPGITTNWDEEMKDHLLTKLSRDGIDIPTLTDLEVVTQVSKWVLDNVPGKNMFTTYDVHFPDGVPAIYPGREAHFETNKGDPSWTTEEQLQHDLFGREMFYNRSRGTCTSSATLLTTILRAVGIPTRMIIAIPAVDASSQRELDLIKTRLSHHQVRKTVFAGLSVLTNSFAAHIYNEVFVGHRWRRLNYSRLGQNILDEGTFGLLTHVNTFNDLSEANLAPTWGSRVRNTVFRNSNPYTALTVSDLFGKHSNIPNPVTSLPEEHTFLTISKVYWFHSSDRPSSIGDGEAKRDGNGHLLAHVNEGKHNGGVKQYKSFYDEVDKRFLLEAEGHKTINVTAQRGYWTRGDNREFYLHIAKYELEQMARDVDYTLRPRNESSNYRWLTDGDVTLRRPQEEPGPQTTPEGSGSQKNGEESSTDETRVHRHLTITRAYFADSDEAPSKIKLLDQGGKNVLAEVSEWFEELGFEQLTTFTQRVDRNFLLLSSGLEPIRISAGIGSVVSGDVRNVLLFLRDEELHKMARGVDYYLTPVNSLKGYQWKLPGDGIRIRLP